MLPRGITATARVCSSCMRYNRCCECGCDPDAAAPERPVVVVKAAAPAPAPAKATVPLAWDGVDSTPGTVGKVCKPVEMTAAERAAKKNEALERGKSLFKFWRKPELKTKEGIIWNTDWKRSEEFFGLLGANAIPTKILLFQEGFHIRINFDALGSALKTNTTLTRLALTDVRIRDEGARRVCEGLKYNTTLTRLELDETSLREKAGEYLSELLKVNTTIRSLDLSHNDLQDRGAISLYKTMLIDSTMMQIASFNLAITKSVSTESKS